MIVRLWRGWTSPANGDAYERLLREEIFQGIAARAIPGYRGIDSLDAVRAFAGEPYETAVVPPRARGLLRRYDQRSAHYEVLERALDAPTGSGTP